MATATINSNLIPNIIGMAKKTLRESGALLGRLNHDFSGASGKLGQVVNIGVPASLTASAVTPANVAPTGSAATIGNRNLTINKLYASTPFALQSTDVQNYDLNSVMEEQVREMVRSVIYQASADTWALYKKIPRIAGTATQSIFNDGSAASIDPLADVYKTLRNAKVDPANFAMVLTTTDEGNAKKVDALQNANEFGARDVVVDGRIGRTQGFDLYVDHQVPSHTIGTITTGLAAKAATAQAVGSTTITATTAASTGACALKTGDSITIGSDVYVLAADATEASAATDVTLTIYYGLKTALSGGEAITLTTGGGTCYQEIAGDLNGISCVARMPAQDVLGFATQGQHFPMVDELTGFPLMLSVYSQYHQVMMQASALYGVDVTDEDRVVRVQTHA